MLSGFFIIIKEHNIELVRRQILPRRKKGEKTIQCGN